MKNEHGYGSNGCAPDVRQRIAAAQSGELAHHWAGDDVGYSGIHKRAARALPPVCSMADETCCGHLESALRHDANGPLREDKRGIYSPRIEDYFRLCRSHHNRYDGKMPASARKSRSARAVAGA